LEDAIVEFTTCGRFTGHLCKDLPEVTRESLETAHSL